VRAPVVYATFVLALTMLPVILLTGLQGAFFAPLGLAFLLATMASLLVALTVTPALALLLLHGHEPRPNRPCCTASSTARRAGRAALRAGRRGAGDRAARRGRAGRRAVVRGELLPSFRERHYVLQVSGPPGASFDWMRATGERISRGLLAIPEVLSVEEQIGRAEAGEDTWPPHRASSTSA
jgi:Cu/Ag efflux pump CusA